MIEGSKDRTGNNHYLYNLITKYSTGWLLNEIGGVGVGDWTNVHLGTDPTGDSNIVHNLDLHHFDDTVVKIYVSPDGTDGSAFEIHGLPRLGAAADYGVTFYYIDANTLKCQTGAGGLIYMDDNGVAQTITNENWYYRISVFSIHCREWTED